MWRKIIGCLLVIILSSGDISALELRSNLERFQNRENVDILNQTLDLFNKLKTYERPDRSEVIKKGFKKLYKFITSELRVWVNYFNKFEGCLAVFFNFLENNLTGFGARLAYTDYGTMQIKAGYKDIVYLDDIVYREDYLSDIILKKGLHKEAQNGINDKSTNRIVNYIKNMINEQMSHKYIKADGIIFYERTFKRLQKFFNDNSKSVKFDFKPKDKSIEIILTYPGHKWLLCYDYNRETKNLDFNKSEYFNKYNDFTEKEPRRYNLEKLKEEFSKKIDDYVKSGDDSLKISETEKELLLLNIPLLYVMLERQEKADEIIERIDIIEKFMVTSYEHNIDPARRINGFKDMCYGWLKEKNPSRFKYNLFILDDGKELCALITLYLNKTQYAYSFYSDLNIQTNIKNFNEFIQKVGLYNKTKQKIDELDEMFRHITEEIINNDNNIVNDKRPNEETLKFIKQHYEKMQNDIQGFSYSMYMVQGKKGVNGAQITVTINDECILYYHIKIVKSKKNISFKRNLAGERVLNAKKDVRDALKSCGREMNYRNKLALIRKMMTMHSVIYKEYFLNKKSKDYLYYLENTYKNMGVDCFTKCYNDLITIEPGIDIYKIHFLYNSQNQGLVLRQNIEWIDTNKGVRTIISEQRLEESRKKDAKEDIYDLLEDNFGDLFKDAGEYREILRDSVVLYEQLRSDRPVIKEELAQTIRNLIISILDKTKQEYKGNSVLNYLFQAISEEDSRVLFNKSLKIVDEVLSKDIETFSCSVFFDYKVHFDLEGYIILVECNQGDPNNLKIEIKERKSKKIERDLIEKLQDFHEGPVDISKKCEIRILLERLADEYKNEFDNKENDNKSELKESFRRCLEDKYKSLQKHCPALMYYTKYDREDILLSLYFEGISRDMRYYLQENLEFKRLGTFYKKNSEDIQFLKERLEYGNEEYINGNASLKYWCIHKFLSGLSDELFVNPGRLDEELAPNYKEIIDYIYNKTISDFFAYKNIEYNHTQIFKNLFYRNFYEYIKANQDSPVSTVKIKQRFITSIFKSLPFMHKEIDRYLNDILAKAELRKDLIDIYFNENGILDLFFQRGIKGLRDSSLAKIIKDKFEGYFRTGITYAFPADYLICRFFLEFRDNATFINKMFLESIRGRKSSVKEMKHYLPLAMLGFFIHLSSDRILDKGSNIDTKTDSTYIDPYIKMWFGLLVLLVEKKRNKRRGHTLDQKKRVALRIIKEIEDRLSDKERKRYDLKKRRAEIKYTNNIDSINLGLTYALNATGLVLKLFSITDEILKIERARALEPVSALDLYKRKYLEANILDSEVEDEEPVMLIDVRGIRDNAVSELENYLLACLYYYGISTIILNFHSLDKADDKDTKNFIEILRKWTQNSSIIILFNNELNKEGQQVAGEISKDFFNTATVLYGLEKENRTELKPDLTWQEFSRDKIKGAVIKISKMLADKEAAKLEAKEKEKKKKEEELEKIKKERIELEELYKKEAAGKKNRQQGNNRSRGHSRTGRKKKGRKKKDQVVNMKRDYAVQKNKLIQTERLLKKGLDKKKDELEQLRLNNAVMEVMRRGPITRNPFHKPEPRKRVKRFMPVIQKGRIPYKKVISLYDVPQDVFSYTAKNIKSNGPIPAFEFVTKLDASDKLKDKLREVIEDIYGFKEEFRFSELFIDDYSLIHKDGFTWKFRLKSSRRRILTINKIDLYVLLLLRLECKEDYLRYRKILVNVFSYAKDVDREVVYRKRSRAVRQYEYKAAKKLVSRRWKDSKVLMKYFEKYFSIIIKLSVIMNVHGDRRDLKLFENYYNEINEDLGFCIGPKDYDVFNKWHNYLMPITNKILKFRSKEDNVRNTYYIYLEEGDNLAEVFNQYVFDERKTENKRFVFGGRDLTLREVNWLIDILKIHSNRIIERHDFGKFTHDLYYKITTKVTKIVEYKGILGKFHVQKDGHRLPASQILNNSNIDIDIFHAMREVSKGNKFFEILDKIRESAGDIEFRRRILSRTLANLSPQQLLEEIKLWQGEKTEKLKDFNNIAEVAQYQTLHRAA